MALATQTRTAPQRLASSIAQDLSATLLRKTGFEFKVQQPHFDSSYSYVDITTPQVDAQLRYPQTTTVGKFTFTPGANVIRVSVMLRQNHPPEAHVQMEPDFMPQKSTFFGLVQRSTVGTVTASIKRVLSRSKSQYGVEHNPPIMGYLVRV